MPPSPPSASVTCRIRSTTKAMETAAYSSSAVRVRASGRTSKPTPHLPDRFAGIWPVPVPRGRPRARWPAALGSARRADREPERVAVAGERAGAVRYAGDDLEDYRVAVSPLTHAGRGLGYRPDQGPGPPPDLTAAVPGIVLGRDLQDAIVPGIAADQPQPGGARGAAQVGDQVNLGFFGDPARPPGQ